MTDKKRVCVIGAGVSGLQSIKQCLAEGFLPTCYEQDPDIAGVWSPSEDAQKTNTPMVWESLITNTSKYQSCSSEFPPPLHWTPYLTWKRLRSYWLSYADHYKLHPYINLNTAVSKVRRTKDHDSTGQWEVVTKKTQSSETEKTEIFDFVLICTGYFRSPRYPNVEGLDTFSGEVAHSFYYKGRQPYHKKKVVVIGNSYSAIDISEDIARDAEDTIVAIGSGSWVLPRLASNGVPFMERILTRKNIHGSSLKDFCDVIMKEGNLFLNHESCNLRPDVPPAMSAIGVSNNFQLDVICGKIQIYPYLVKVDGQKAYFSDGSVVDNVDAIVCCTGFDPDVSILKEENIMDELGKLELFNWMWPLARKQNTLAFIGHNNIDFAVAPLSELQCRFATKVFKGKKHLPPQTEMKGWVDDLNAIFVAKHYRYKAQGIVLLDKIAAELGVYPSFKSVVLRDPLLAWRLWYGPVFSAHYRLVGEDSNFEEARKTSHLAYESRGHVTSGRQLSPLRRIDVTGPKWIKMLFIWIVIPMCILFAFNLHYGSK